jgi:hypothetical protein
MSAGQPVQQNVSSISEEDIRRRAYELYEARNGNGGDPVADWYDAERELRGLSSI